MPSSDLDEIGHSRERSMLNIGWLDRSVKGLIRRRRAIVEGFERTA
jgi:hypothetical protein